jgi:hypothetical protein
VNLKCDVDFVVLQFDLFVLAILQIEPMSNFPLYAESVVVFLVLLLPTVQLFDDVLLSVPMTTTLMSLVIVVVIANMM